MANFPINTNPPARDLRWFAGLLIPFCAAIAGLWWRRTGATTGPSILFGAGTACGLLGLAQPSFIRWLYVAWMTAVWPIGWVVSMLLLGGIFFLVVTPIGWMLRLAGRNPTPQSFDKSATTYWIERPSESTDTRRYFRQF